MLLVAAGCGSGGDDGDDGDDVPAVDGPPGGPDASGITFGDDPAALHHHDGARSTRVPRVRFVESLRNHRVQLRP